MAVLVTSDAIALVVGVGNPLSGGLTQAQVRDIFQGRITNWSAVGGPNRQIRAINPPAISGTHRVHLTFARAKHSDIEFVDLCHILSPEC